MLTHKQTKTHMHRRRGLIGGPDKNQGSGITQEERLSFSPLHSRPPVSSRCHCVPRDSDPTTITKLLASNNNSSLNRTARAEAFKAEPSEERYYTFRNGCMTKSAAPGSITFQDCYRVGLQIENPPNIKCFKVNTSQVGETGSIL